MGGIKVNIFDKLIDKLKETPRTIVLPDGPDKRVMDAAEKLTKHEILKEIKDLKIEE